MKLFFLGLLFFFVIISGCGTPPSERFSKPHPSELVLQFDGTTEKYFNKQIRRRVVDPDTIATIWSGLLDLKKGSQSYFMRDVYWRINILDSNNKVTAALLHYDDSYFNFRVGLDYYQNDSLYLLLRELILVDSLGEQSRED